MNERKLRFCLLLLAFFDAAAADLRDWRGCADGGKRPAAHGVRTRPAAPAAADVWPGKSTDGNALRRIRRSKAAGDRRTGRWTRLEAEALTFSPEAGGRHDRGGRTYSVDKAGA